MEITADNDKALLGPNIEDRPECRLDLVLDELKIPGGFEFHGFDGYASMDHVRTSCERVNIPSIHIYTDGI